MNRLSKKFLFILAAVVLLAGTGYVIWQYYKYKIVSNTLSTTVAGATDSIYSIHYDSLFFDEITGSASVKNIRIIPDTNRVKKLDVENMPDMLLNVSIKSLTVTGVKTAKALQGKKLEGDSVIIDDPDITLYSLKPLEKGTKFQNEANRLYRELLGKLDVIRVGFVYVNHVNVKGIDFFTKRRNFDFMNGKFLLEDVLVDSAHFFDTTRILFCKQAAFSVDSFFSYNHNRKELTVKNVQFSGKQKQLSFGQITANRFQNDSSEGIRLLDASHLKLNGVNSNEIVKNKNLVVDTILCREIIFYELPLEKLKTTAIASPRTLDSTGFMNVYGVYVKHFSFPKVSFVPLESSNYSLGNIAITVNEVKAGRVIDLQRHPMNYTKEAEVSLESLSLRSRDGNYHFNFKKLRLNSLYRELSVDAIGIEPLGSEKQFAGRFHFQKDRYDVKLSGISLKNIDMNNLLEKQLKASELVIQQTSARIYRDLHKPLEKESRVGNYLSQLIRKIPYPVFIAKATLDNAFIEYRENEKVSDSIGVVPFYHSSLNISNITNMPGAIQKNNVLTVSFHTTILSLIPLTGYFQFILGNDNGDFVVDGHASGFDAQVLNKVSVPMALVKISSGKINSVDFHFKGNNTGAKGNFVMKYDQLEVEVLKHDKITHKVRKRGLVSLVANLIVENNNPGISGLRKVNPQYDRNMYKSFFNLIWKTIFTGIKKTLGAP